MRTFLLLFVFIILKSSVVFAAQKTITLKATLKQDYPVNTSDKGFSKGFDMKNYTKGYLAEFADGYIDVSERFESIDKVCVEADLYKEDKREFLSATFVLFGYKMLSDGRRDINLYQMTSGSYMSGGKSGFKNCYVDTGFEKSFIREGKIAFSPFTSSKDTFITDIKFTITGEPKSRAKLLTIDADSHTIGANQGQMLSYLIEAGRKYEIKLVNNNATHNRNRNIFKSLGVAFSDVNQNRVIRAVEFGKPLVVITQGKLDFFLIGDEFENMGRIDVSIKKLALN
ncbi:hypothetical protein [Veronia pacifica]|uniref:Uncharacterized protein n=1 Tax=Veronia pacifica TaxID=1080227 RepID=A0A1C3E9M5_9GAMM|nr:hypothetical protein [Veronia pacifica]ODA29869.1 hypothetical protein A8L45_21455 [Veronia pacifica]